MKKIKTSIFLINFFMLGYALSNPTSDPSVGKYNARVASQPVKSQQMMKSPAKKSICEAFFDQYDIKNIFDKDYLCKWKNQEFRTLDEILTSGSITNVNANDFTDCFKKVYSTAQQSKDDVWVKNCTYLSFFRAVRDGFVLDNYNALKAKYPHHIAFNSSKKTEIFDLVKSHKINDLFNCVEEIKDNQYSLESNIDTCLDKGKRRVYTSKEFKTCVDKFEHFGYRKSYAQTECFEDEVRKVVLGSNLTQCEKAANGLKIENYSYPKSGFCLFERDFRENYNDDRFISCIEKGFGVTYGDYYRDDSNTWPTKNNQRKDFRQRVIQDCKNKSHRQSGEVAEGIQLYQQIEINTEYQFVGKKGHTSPTRLGGISSLYYDAKTRRLDLLSDDSGSGKRGEYNLGPRLYRFSLSHEKDKYKLSPLNIEFLKFDKKSDIHIDPEGYVVFADGSSVISSEANTKSSNPKMLIRFDADKKMIKAMDLPGNFLIQYEKKKSKRTYRECKSIEDKKAPPQNINEEKVNGRQISSQFDGPPQPGSVPQIRLAAAGVDKWLNKIPPAYGTNPNYNGGGYRYSRPAPTPSYNYSYPKGSNTGSVRLDYEPVRDEECEDVEREVEEVVSKGGMNYNQAIEALTLSPDETHLFLANEGPLVEDKGKVKFSNGYDEVRSSGFDTKNDDKDSVRIVRYRKEKGEFVPAEQYRYDLEDEVENGLTGLLALSNNELLVLERNYDNKKKKNTVRLYLVHLSPELAIATADQNKKIKNFPALEKKLLLDFDDLIPHFAPGFNNLDNYEAIGFGPVLPNGNRSIIVASDNNFNDWQRTSILIFEITDERILSH